MTQSYYHLLNRHNQIQLFKDTKHDIWYTYRPKKQNNINYSSSCVFADFDISRTDVDLGPLLLLGVETWDESTVRFNVNGVKS